MKGVILAGGLGTRLYPLTKITNKHLLPVHDKPMIYYPIQALVNSGIRDILIVTGGNNAGDFLRLLGNGKEFGLKHINYTYQEGEGGIAAALSLAEYFAEGHKICVILGDNIIETNIRQSVQGFESRNGEPRSCSRKCRMRSASACRDSAADLYDRRKTQGSALELCRDRHLHVRLRSFRIIKTLKPSGRGELEITDVNNEYIRRGTLTHDYLEGGGPMPAPSNPSSGPATS